MIVICSHWPCSLCLQSVCNKLIYINCRHDSLMQTRTQPKRTGQQAVNFGPNLLVVDVGSSIVLPSVLWVGPFFGRPDIGRPLARRHRVGNLYRVIHRILVRSLAPVPPRVAPPTKRNFPISLPDASVVGRGHKMLC